MTHLSRHQKVVRVHHRLTTAPLFGNVPGFQRAHVTVLEARSMRRLFQVFSGVGPSNRWGES